MEDSLWAPCFQELVSEILDEKESIRKGEDGKGKISATESLLIDILEKTVLPADVAAAKSRTRQV